MSDKIIKVLIVIIFLMMIFNLFKNDHKYKEYLETENKKIAEQLDSLKDILSEKLDSIKIIEKKQTIIRNYYNDIYKNLPVFTDYSIADSLIRMQLDTLGSARFDP